MKKEDLVAIINELYYYASPNDIGRSGEYTCKGCGGFSREVTPDDLKFPHEKICDWLLLLERIDEAQTDA